MIGWCYSFYLGYIPRDVTLGNTDDSVYGYFTSTEIIM
jgi:hypothetical protein